jgi:hypothetical protein
LGKIGKLFFKERGGKMNNTYLKDAYGGIFGVKKEKTISLKYEELHKGMDIQILVTLGNKDKYKEQYFNVYFIDPIFKEEPMNNLQEQIPIENEPKNWEEYLRIEYISYWAWRQFKYEGYFTKES